MSSHRISNIRVHILSDEEIEFLSRDKSILVEISFAFQSLYYTSNDHELNFYERLKKKEIKVIFILTQNCLNPLPYCLSYPTPLH